MTDWIEGMVKGKKKVRKMKKYESEGYSIYPKVGGHAWSRKKKRARLTMWIVKKGEFESIPLTKKEAKKYRRQVGGIMSPIHSDIKY